MVSQGLWAADGRKEAKSRGFGSLQKAHCGAVTFCSQAVPAENSYVLMTMSVRALCVQLCKEDLSPPYKFQVQVVRRSRTLSKATYNLPFLFSIRIYSTRNKDGSKIPPRKDSVVIFSTNYFSTDKELALFQIRL